MIHQIVIIGGGFGGVGVAKALASASWRMGGNIHITLIDKNRYHTFYPNLYEVATAYVPENSAISEKINFHELFSSASCSFDEIFLDDLNISFLKGEVGGVNFKEQKVILKSEEEIQYDFLVMGAGSETNYFNIPGLYENSIPLKNLADSLLVRNSLDELFANSPKNKVLKIVIGGGGFTGCEFAGELIGFLEKLSKIHGRPKFYFECSIIDGAPNLLSGGATPWAQKKAKERLENLGVKLLLGKKVKEVKNKKIILEDDSIVEYDALIWAGGVRGNMLSKNLESIRLERGSCIFVDSYLRISPYKNVFGIGDAIYCVNEKTGFPLPMTASMAIREAKFVAENVKRAIEKRKLLNYEPKFPGFVIPIGGKYALFEKGPIHISGFLPWFLKDLISLKYWISILRIKRGFNHWRRGLQIFIKND